jgi:alpha-glucosidase
LQVSEKLLAFKRLYQGEEVWVYAALEPTGIELPHSENLLTGERLEGPVRLEGLGVFRLVTQAVSHPAP